MKEIFTTHKYLFISFATLWLIGFTYWCANGKEAAFLIINGAHTPFLDFAMPIFTMLGEFYLLIPMLLFVTLRNVKVGAGMFIGYALASTTAQVLKFCAPWHNDRPSLYFYNDARVHYITNYFNSVSHSFPSGHTTLAFSVMLYLALTVKQLSLQLYCLLIAVLVGYSRVYLAQHFVEDVLAGSLIGAAFAVLTMVLFTNNARINHPHLNKSYIA